MKLWRTERLAEDSVEYSVQEEEVNQNSVNVSSQQKKDYSDTYNQETGVLEADIVKTDGNIIYYACGNVINAANVKDGKFLNTIQLLKDEEAINDMYLYNNILIVISSANNYSEDVNYGEENDCCELFTMILAFRFILPESILSLSELIRRRDHIMMCA